MANWIFTTPVIREAPFAWNPLMERFSMNRAISVQEVSPGVYEQVRYDAYTQEIGAVNLPRNPNGTDLPFWPAPSDGLHYFRGGYAWVVDDTTKANLINSNIGIDNTNFTPAS